MDTSGQTRRVSAFDRFDDQARQVLKRSEDLARADRSAVIDVDHLTRGRAVGPGPPRPWRWRRSVSSGGPSSPRWRPGRSAGPGRSRPDTSPSPRRPERSWPRRSVRPTGWVMPTWARSTCCSVCSSRAHHPRAGCWWPTGVGAGPARGGATDAGSGPPPLAVECVPVTCGPWWRPGWAGVADRADAAEEGDDPTLVPRLVAHIKALWDAGRASDVLAEAERLMAPGVAPASAQATIRLYGALAVVRLPRPERAEEAAMWLERSATDPTTRASALHLRGRLLTTEGRRTEAMQVLDVALAELEPATPADRASGCRASSAATDPADAVRLLEGLDAQLALAASDRDRVAVLVVAAAAIASDLVAERFTQAEALAAHAAHLAPEDTSVQVVGWSVWAVTGRGADAVEGLRRAVAPDPHLPGHVLGGRHAFLARALLDGGDQAAGAPPRRRGPAPRCPPPGAGRRLGVASTTPRAPGAPRADADLDCVGPPEHVGMAPVRSYAAPVPTDHELGCSPVLRALGVDPVGTRSRGRRSCSSTRRCRGRPTSPTSRSWPRSTRRSGPRDAGPPVAGPGHRRGPGAHGAGTSSARGPRAARGCLRPVPPVRPGGPCDRGGRRGPGAPRGPGGIRLRDPGGGGPPGLHPRQARTGAAGRPGPRCGPTWPGARWARPGLHLAADQPHRRPPVRAHRPPPAHRHHVGLADLDVLGRVLDRRGPFAEVASHYRGTSALATPAAQVVDREVMTTLGWPWLDHRPRAGSSPWTAPSGTWWSRWTTGLPTGPGGGWSARVTEVGRSPVPACGLALEAATKDSPVLQVVGEWLHQPPLTRGLGRSAGLPPGPGRAGLRERGDDR